MKLIFSPIRSDETLDLSVKGDILFINGEELDLSVVPEGAVLPMGSVANQFINGTIFRQDGELHVELLLPHGPEASDAARHPEPITISEGDVELPV